jgi:protein SCO1/2/putative membrane protein
MNVVRSYRRGILVVVWTVLAAALFSMVVVGPAAPQRRAAQELGDRGEELGPFQLTERSGRRVTHDDLADRVAIVSFIFTRCQLSCPRITSIMKSLQEKLEGTDVQLVSLSVDPDHDTPEVLRSYADSYGADPQRWWFLTGPRSEIYDLIQNRFKLSVMDDPGADGEKSEFILHSDRLGLVDRGRIVGLFDSNEPEARKALVAQASRRALPAWVRVLPTVNASLNALCAFLLVLGWSFIRRRPAASELARSEVSPSPLGSFRARAHLTCMILAVSTSALFLGCYLTYHYHAGSVAFRGEGPARLTYFTVLISHTILATFGVVPLVAITLLRAYRRQFNRHRSIAALTLPIWLYVSITGVVIYLMLYHLPTSPS